MTRRNRRIAAVAVTLVSLGAVLFASAAASAIEIPYKFENWAVWGSLTPKKLNEPVVLPKGSTYNGISVLTSTPTEIYGSTSGEIFVPPFSASLKLLGLVPTTVGVTFTQVGPADGTLVEAPASQCVGERFAGTCLTLHVITKADLGITKAGSSGLELPTQCHTSEPVEFSLSATLTLGELLSSGPGFTGTVTIPSISCEGLEGLVLAPAFTALMSGPENPYVLHISPHEPAAPTVTAEPASLVSQVSARMTGAVEPNGYALSECKFEYGTTEAYGSSVACVAPPGSGNSVSAPVSGLAEGTPYDYRIVATNSLGTSTSANESFTTLAPSKLEYGQCRASKKAGEYSNAGCTSVAEKKGVPDHKGAYEWFPGPAAKCVAAKKGDYTNAGCTTKSAKAGKGGYEVAPGPGYSSSGGAVTLETPGLGSGVVTCSATSARGEVTGTQSGVDRLTFTGCETAGKQCASEGADGTPSGSSGVITTNLLDTRLLGPVKTEIGEQAWIDYSSAEHQPYWAEFGCGASTLYRITGSVSGVQTGDVGAPSTASQTKINATLSEQALYSELSETSGTSWSAPSASTLVLTLENTAASSVEIRT
ncbi:MAG: hypothetical protein ACRDJX_03675 [Solirubrobacteraceae bacterium]